MGYEAAVFLSDEDATTRLGEAIAPLLRPGDTILLEGQIGAGKTHFVRSVVRALLRSGKRREIDVPSPTYTLVQTYHALSVTVWHADLYRLTDSSEVAELGLDEAFQSAIVLVEWPDRLEDPPGDALTLRFDVQNEGRMATFASPSSRWKILDNAIANL